MELLFQVLLQFGDSRKVVEITEQSKDEVISKLKRLFDINTSRSPSPGDGLLILAKNCCFKNMKTNGRNGSMLRTCIELKTKPNCEYLFNATRLHSRKSVLYIPILILV